MKTHPLFPAFLFAVLAQGCASGGTLDRPVGTPDAGPATVTRGGGATDPAREASRPSISTTNRLEAIYAARADSALQGYHTAEVHFMTGMISHHAQALVMSGFAPENGASATIQTLCARIINAQSDEIAIMQRWLAERELPVPDVRIEHGHLMAHGPGHTMQMPGMLTPDQLQELRAARGADFDRLFLTYMIMHHEGAVSMVRDLFNTPVPLKVTSFSSSPPTFMWTKRPRSPAWISC